MKSRNYLRGQRRENLVKGDKMDFMLDWGLIEKLVDGALQEDIGTGDLTSELLIPPEKMTQAEIVLKEPCCLAGIPIAAKVFESVGKPVRIRWFFQDGEFCQPGRIALLEGQARAILKTERTALNFLQHMSGIATKTRKIVNLVRPYSVDILDTRKTIPGWRHLAKYAVRIGGGKSHRRGLDDAILVKRNHFLLLSHLDRFEKLVRDFSNQHPEMMIVIEASNKNELEQVIQAGADVVLLDNFSPEQIKEVVNEWKGRIVFEASGNIHLDNVKDYAASGVNRISMGSLTHTVNAVDFSLRIIPEN